MRNLEKNYTLRKVSKNECSRRGFFVYEMGNAPFLIALKNEHKTFRLKDNTTWGHLFVGGKNWGRFNKLRKNYEFAYIICEKPQVLKIEVIPFGKNVYTGETQKGEYYRCVNGESTFKHYSLNGIARSNKALFNCRIGTVIN